MAGLEGDDAGAALDHIVTQFNTYEDYLDSQITTQDLYYLEVRLRLSPARGGTGAAPEADGASEHVQSVFSAHGGEDISQQRPCFAWPGSLVW